MRLTIITLVVQKAEKINWIKISTNELVDSGEVLHKCISRVDQVALRISMENLRL